MANKPEQPIEVDAKRLSDVLSSANLEISRILDALAGAGIRPGPGPVADTNSGCSNTGCGGEEFLKRLATLK